MLGRDLCVNGRQVCTALLVPARGGLMWSSEMREESELGMCRGNGVLFARERHM